MVAIKAIDAARDAAVSCEGRPGDASLGLDEYYARSYDAGSASWLEPDSWRGSMTSPQSMNRYAYVENSPVAYSDSFGFARNRPGGGRVKRKPTNANRRYHSSIPPYVQMQLNRSKPAAGLPASGGGGGVPRVSPRDPVTGHVFRQPLRTGLSTSPNAISQRFTPVRHADTSTGCAHADWGCRVAAAEKPRCSGVGKFRHCPNPGPGDNSYSYSYRWDMGPSEQVSPERLMFTFKQNAKRVFPFDISGCSKVMNGTECTLRTERTNLPFYIPVPVDATGVVGVNTTPVSVKFTVLERGYFDAPGSTIVFRAEEAGGRTYLVHEGDGHGAAALTVLGIQGFKFSKQAWRVQVEELKKALVQ